MRIAIDARPLHWPGIGRYIRELANQLIEQEHSSEFHILVSQKDHARFFTGSGKTPGLTVVRAKVHSLSEQAELPWLLYKKHIDLFHSPSSLVAPFWTPCPMVLTVHDLLFKAQPEFLDGLVARSYFNVIHGRAVAQAARIITVSDFTRKELGRFHPGAVNKACTVYNGVAEAFTGKRKAREVEGVQGKIGSANPYFIAVGSLKRHKNFVTLLRGFAKLLAKGIAPVHLFVVSRQDLRNPDKSVAGLVKTLSLSEHVTFLDNLSEAQLAAAYSGAEAFVSTSLYEGFGLPVVEAMASGVPLIVSDIEVFREIAGGSAIYVDPCSAASLATAMQQALSDKEGCRRIADSACERSTMFSWSGAAARTLSVYREAVAL